MLVDDNKSSLEILKETLESFSFEVLTAESGIQALHILKRDDVNDTIKIVLMDWEMPEMDGLTAAESIRRDHNFDDIKIIMLCTSYANDELHIKSELLGLSGILTKPIRHSTLYDTIIRAINEEEDLMNLHQPAPMQKELVSSLRGHLLLVEDNEINQQVASELLKTFGVTVEIATNGMDAIEKVKTSGNPSRFDLVLMDLQMPVMGGYAATQAIRKMDAYTSLPIIAMTADAMEGVKERCIEMGMMDFLTKPINPAIMLEVIRKWLPKNPQVDRPAIETNTSTDSDHIIEGIDVEDGLSHLGGNRALFNELLQKFVDRNEQFISTLRKEFHAGHFDLVKRNIHTLKGISGNLGMKDLYRACVDAEKNLGSEAHAFEAFVSDLGKELEIVLRGLRFYYKDGNATKSVTVAFSDVLDQITKLKVLLKNQDPAAVAVARELGSVKGYEKEFEALRNCMKSYDFDTAIGILETIKPGNDKITPA